MTFIETCAKVQTHHELVSERYPFVVMTSLVGSQNYQLDTDNSDVDTCSFVLPTKEELMLAEPSVGTEFECSDGKCVVKDFRVGLNLLLKTSPNSLEWFVSKWKAYHPDFAEDLDWIIGNKLDALIYANHRSMFSACMGLSKQLGTRNMAQGKRVAHLLRIRDLWESYSRHDRPANRILEFRSGETRLEALYAKTNDVTDEYVAQKIQESEAYFAEQKAKFNPDDPEIQKIEAKAKKVIELFRRQIVSTWLKLI